MPTAHPSIFVYLHEDSSFLSIPLKKIIEGKEKKIMNELMLTR